VPGTCVILPLDYCDGVFFLTRREQIVVAFILVSLVAGAGIRYLRMTALLPQSQPLHSTNH